MYIPELYREDNRAEILALIRKFPFALVAGVQNGLPIASHIPHLEVPGRALQWKARGTHWQYPAPGHVSPHAAIRRMPPQREAHEVVDRTLYRKPFARNYWVSGSRQ
jgi:hypothetical protein